MVKSVEEAVGMVGALCRLPPAANYVRDTQLIAFSDGLTEAIRARDTPWLFGWLLRSFSYQGVSDRIASQYMEAHPNPSWADLQDALARRPLPCPKLESADTYRGCGYRKTSATCANPPGLSSCPVPTLDLRKGDLNQLAVSLFLFLRDRCQGDLVGFIDQVLDAAEPAAGVAPARAQQKALITAFSEIHAVSAKLINMTLALLLTANPARRAWTETGRSMVAIDSLVHNFLHRTGILTLFEANHAYGPVCAGTKGCTAIIDQLTDHISGNQVEIGADVFPRLVQFAIWSFCAEAQINVCNGRQIDDRFPCTNMDCHVGDLCGRIALRST